MHSRRAILRLSALSITSGLTYGAAWAQAIHAWKKVGVKAREQTVYLNAWAGAEKTNHFIAWTAAWLRARYDITGEHVRLRPGVLHKGRIEATLTAAGLAGFADHDPATMSGCQRVRAALIRTLLAEPQALLLDEQLSRLEAQLRADFRSFVFAHARARSLPMLLLTHDAADAVSAGGPKGGLLRHARRRIFTLGASGYFPAQQGGRNFARSGREPDADKRLAAGRCAADRSIPCELW